MTNYEKKSTYTLRVEVEDQGGLKKSQPITVSVKDLIEPTTLKLSVNTISENLQLNQNFQNLLIAYDLQ